jgi:cell fate (sporulation/competence/biofilm development) regulator YlbF (YheA/YmcA/DUF963 family)
VATSTKFPQREDKLPLERALRALEDVHRSLKEFSKQRSVIENMALNGMVQTTRHKAKKLRKLTTELASRWDRTFEEEG